jgi:hypothetical protein
VENPQADENKIPRVLPGKENASSEKNKLMDQNPSLAAQPQNKRELDLARTKLTQSQDLSHTLMNDAANPRDQPGRQVAVHVRTKNKIANSAIQ